MIEERKIAFDNISRTLAITRYDIEQHQLVNDQSLNIHGENWFRDIFNFVYSNNFFVNANIETKTGNASAVDLIDKDKELAYQITTTRTKEKVDNTLKKIKTTEYKDYTLKIFFLLEKSKFNKDTKQYFKDEYSINIEDYLIDYTDLLKSIEALETDKLIELNKKLFIKSAEKYTDNITLSLIFQHLVKEKKNVIVDYMDDDFGTVDTNAKLSLNKINEKISAEIKRSLDYRVILDDFCNVDNLLTDLKSYIIDDIYKNILLEKLKQKILVEVKEIIATATVIITQQLIQLFLQRDKKAIEVAINSLTLDLKERIDNLLKQAYDDIKQKVKDTEEEFFKVELNKLEVEELKSLTQTISNSDYESNNSSINAMAVGQLVKYIPDFHPLVTLVKPFVPLVLAVFSIFSSSSEASTNARAELEEKRNYHMAAKNQADDLGFKFKNQMEQDVVNGVLNLFNGLIEKYIQISEKLNKDKQKNIQDKKRLLEILNSFEQ